MKKSITNYHIGTFLGYIALSLVSCTQHCGTIFQGEDIQERCEQYQKLANQNDFQIIYINKGEDYASYSQRELLSKQRGIVLNSRETSVVKECMQYISLYRTPFPTTPVNWFHGSGEYLILCKGVIALRIGEDGENTIMGLTSPFFWWCTLRELDSAFQKAKKKAK